MTNAESLAAGGRRAPSRLTLVRHAQSVGNLADASARERGLARLELETRDADTPLSDVGERQAHALGEHLRDLPGDERPDVVLCSPYERARRTAGIALEVAGLDHALVIDERLRERDLGVLDGYTRRGIEADYPDEAARRSRVGKLYYRPAGGESWVDVALRVRSLLRDLGSEYDGRAVWAFSHQAVIMSFRYVLESLDEATLMRIDRDEPLPNVSLTSYVRGDDGALALESYARTTALADGEAPVTREEPVGEGAVDDDAGAESADVG